MGTCKTCGWWDSGTCDVPDQTEELSVKEGDTTYMQLVVRVADDTNLNVSLKTGPDFGCVRHVPSKRPNSP